MREAAALAQANAKAQEREALNVFEALPLKDKIRFLELLFLEGDKKNQANTAPQEKRI